MNNSLQIVIAILGMSLFAGCTTDTTIKVQMVLGIPARLKNDSPAGRKALLTLNVLNDFHEAEINLKTNYEHYLPRQLTNRTVVALRRQNESADAKWQDLQTKHSQSFIALTNHVGRIEARIAIFDAFFSTNNALGLGPRIDWEVMRTAQFLTQEKNWLEYFFKPNLQAEQELTTNAMNLLRSGGQNEAEADSSLGLNASLILLDQIASSTTQNVTAIESQGFGDFVTIGVAKIDLSDSQYREIFGSINTRISFEPVTMSCSDVVGDASVIVVQESPGQFRTYQINNDPTVLMKNVSMLVSKATAAAAKYMSGGVMP